MATKKEEIYDGPRCVLKKILVGHLLLASHRLKIRDRSVRFSHARDVRI